MLRTEKGKKLFDAICDNLKIKEVTYEEGIRNNPSEYKSCIRPPQRDTFFMDMKAMDFEELEKKYIPPINTTFKIIVKRKIKNIIKSVVRATRKRDKEKRQGKEMEYSLCFMFDCQEWIQ